MRLEIKRAYVQLKICSLKLPWALGGFYGELRDVQLDPAPEL